MEVGAAVRASVIGNRRFQQMAAGGGQKAFGVDVGEARVFQCRAQQGIVRERLQSAGAIELGGRRHLRPGGRRARDAASNGRIGLGDRDGVMGEFADASPGHLDRARQPGARVVVFVGKRGEVLQALREQHPRFGRLADAQRILGRGEGAGHVVHADPGHAEMDIGGEKTRIVGKDLLAMAGGVGEAGEGDEHAAEI